jgi:hypothetical protein
MMAAEMLGVMLDCPRAADIPPALRSQVERMMHDPRALDAVVTYLMRIPLGAVPPRLPLPGDGFEFAKGLLGEWGRRLEERTQGGQ